MTRTYLLALALLTGAAVACGGDDGGTAASPTTGAASDAEQYPPCDFTDGQLALDSNVCTDQTGGVQFLGAYDCLDGRKLVSVDDTMGMTPGYYFTGDVFHAGVLESGTPHNEAYGAAVDECQGNGAFTATSQS